MGVGQFKSQTQVGWSVWRGGVVGVWSGGVRVHVGLSVVVLVGGVPLAGYKPVRRGPRPYIFLVLRNLSPKGV